jgi:hypothetical protein
MVSRQLVEQRVRNRIIEMLEWLLACEHTPPEPGMDALINFWDDWVSSPFDPRYFLPPVFTGTEQALICQVSRAIDAFCDATPASITDVQAALKLPEWAAVIAAVRPALLIMTARGRMSEEEALHS